MDVMDSEVRVATGKACEMLGVHPNTLRRWVDEGRISATRLPGGARRFLVSEIKDFQKEYSKSVN